MVMGPKFPCGKMSHLKKPPTNSTTKQEHISTVCCITVYKDNYNIDLGAILVDISRRICVVHFSAFNISFLPKRGAFSAKKAFERYRFGQKEEKTRTSLASR